MLKFFRRMTCKLTRIEQAAQREAVMRGELTVATAMAEFYRGQKLAIDHEEDAWGFAQVWQKERDARGDVTRYTRLADEAQARVRALRGVK